MGVLDADNLDIDPYQLFDSWFAEAKKAKLTMQMRWRLPR